MCLVRAQWPLPCAQKLTNQAFHAPGRRRTWDARIKGHHLKRQDMRRTEERPWGKEEGWGGGCTGHVVASRDVNSRSRSEQWQDGGQLQPLFLGVPAAWAGSFEKDVYFSAVPSQKSMLSWLATITEQLLWLGGPAPACLTPAAFCQRKKKQQQEEHHLHCPKFTLWQQKNRRKADTKANVTQCVCIRIQWHELWNFLFNAGGSGVGGGSLFSTRTCGRMSWSRYLQSDRHSETYMTLPYRDLPAELIMTRDMLFTATLRFAPCKYRSGLVGEDHRVFGQQLVWQV